MSARENLIAAPSSSVVKALGLLAILGGAALLVRATEDSALAIIAPPGRIRTTAQPLEAPFDDITAKRMHMAWAHKLKRKSIETNSIGIGLVLIPPGTFVLGRTESLPELAKAFPMIEIKAQNAGAKRIVEAEQPAHQARITKPFCIGKYNVTRAQFQQFVENTAYRTEAEVDGKGGSGYTKGENPPLAKKPSFNWRNTGFPQEDDSPVVNVSCNDANLFCRWLSKKEGKTYRLPSEAEWEYACCAGTITRYCTGNRPDDLVAVANIADVAYFTMLDGGTSSAEATDRRRVMGMMLNGNDQYAFTSPVGRFKPNAFGLYDMHGNASTWCGDWFEADYYAHSPLDDPRGPRAGTARVVRGGSWQFIPAYCRSAARFAYTPSSHEPFLGFRVVCELGAK